MTQFQFPTFDDVAAHHANVTGRTLDRDNFTFEAIHAQNPLTGDDISDGENHYLDHLRAKIVREFLSKSTAYGQYTEYWVWIPAGPLAPMAANVMCEELKRQGWASGVQQALDGDYIVEISGF